MSLSSVGVVLLFAALLLSAAEATDYTDTVQPNYCFGAYFIYDTSSTLTLSARYT